jgi:hypothetical protein
MINLNVRPIIVDRVSSCYTITICDAELTALMYNFGEVNIKISKPQSAKTLRQNSTVHALLSAFYFSGFASFPDKCTLAKFKMIKKIEYGLFIETEYKEKLVPVPYSFADASKEQVSEFIKKLKKEIELSGAHEDEKVSQILAGMSDEVV